MNQELINAYEKSSLWSNISSEKEIDKRAKRQHEILEEMDAEDIDYLLQEAIKYRDPVPYKIMLKKLKEQKLAQAQR